MKLINTLIYVTKWVIDYIIEVSHTSMGRGEWRWAWLVRADGVRCVVSPVWTSYESAKVREK